MKINKNIEISDRCEPFIIAEAGINHDGDFDKAIELIDLVKCFSIILAPTATAPMDIDIPKE